MKTQNIPDGFQVIPAERLDFAKAELVTDQEGILVKWDEESKSFVKWFHSDFEDSRDREASQAQEVSKINESEYVEYSQKFVGSFNYDEFFGCVIASSIEKDRMFVEDQEFLESQESAAIPALYQEIISKVPLTDKQKEFLQMYIKGFSLSEIADGMGISKGGAQKHSQFVMKKLKKFFKR